MPNVEMSAEVHSRLERTHYLVAYLVKLYNEHSTEQSFTVPVTIRKEGDSVFVVEVEGNEIKFDA